MFTELIEKTKTHTNKIVSISQVVVRQERNFEAYTSLFPYSEGIKNHIELTKTPDRPKGTLSGFEGDVYCKTVWFDIDCEEAPAKSVIAARELVNRLLNKYKLKEEHITIFFSGAKGFHVSFSTQHFGGCEPCNELPYQIKRFVERITDGLQYIDFSIYNINRFFRMPFSKHTKTGLFKIPLTLEELQNKNILDIRQMAEQSRTDFKFNKPRQIVINSELQKAWILAKSKPEETKLERDILDTFPTDQEAIFQKAVEMTERKAQYVKGERNNFIFKLAAWCNDLGFGESYAKNFDAQIAVERIGLFLHEKYNETNLDIKETEIIATIESAYKRASPNFGSKQEYLKEETDYHINQKTKLLLMDKAKRLTFASRLTKREVVEILLAINATKKFPISEDDVYSIVTSYVIEDNERAEDDFGATMESLMTEYYIDIVNATNDFNIGLQPIDRIEQGEYSGKVIGIIGKAGTKKSLLLKEIMRVVAEQGLRSIYSSMEDGKLGQFKRFLASSFAPVTTKGDIGEDIEVSAAQYLKSQIKKHPEKMKEAVLKNAQILADIYGSNIIFDDKTAMSYDDYEHFLNKIIDNIGAVSLLGIDGLSMMKSSGDELAAAVENSKKAKELSNKYKICVPLLIHVPSAVDRFRRDLYDYTRGGSKVADNCDAFISLSQCRKEGTIDEIDDNLIYVSYWGKRTSGARIKFIIRLNPVTLKLELAEDLDPRDFDD